MKSVIIGAGSYGEVYLSYLTEAGIEVLGFLDDNETLTGLEIRGIPVMGGVRTLETLQTTHGVEAVYCPLGNNHLRVKFLKYASELGYQTPNFIHPTVVISPNVNISSCGVYILPSTVVMPCCDISDFVMVSANSIISHHTTINEGVFMSFGVNLGANIVVHKYAYIGISATIMTGVRELGEDCLIGAGAVVIKDVPANAIMAGVPARLLKYKDSEVNQVGGE